MLHESTSGAGDAVPAVFEGARETYDVVRTLGRGGFGVTHLARRRSDGLEVVVKQLRLDRLDDWKAFDLFEREAKVLEALRHPNIPAFVDHFELEEGEHLRGFALVQTYVEGPTLAQLQPERSDASRLRAWLSRLLEICQYLHERTPPVIHRDISPKNVIIRSDGEPVLIDFGAVQNVVRSADTVASTAAGTFGYAAPEQLIGRAVPASDLYGLAMTYLAVATGQEPEALPYEGNRVDVSAALREHDTHPRLALLLEEMAEPDASRRPTSAADVLGRLQGIPLAGAAPRPMPAEPGAEEGPAAQVERTWRARMKRAVALGQATYAVAEIPDVDDFDHCGIGDTGAEAIVALGFMEGGVAGLDLQNYRLQRWQHEVPDIFRPKVALDLDGRTALLVSFDRGALLRRKPDGEIEGRGIRGLPHTMMMGHRGLSNFALSPDHKLLACLADRGITVFDLDTGTVAQTLEHSERNVSMSASLRFVPDGTALLVESFADSYVVDPKGTTTHLENTMFALGNDGRTVARASRSELMVGVIETWVPLAWRDDPRRVCSLQGRVEVLRFSPDDRSLVFEYGGRVSVVDLERSEVVMTVGDPYRPGLPMRNVIHAGISGDGRRLLVYGDCFPHPLATERDSALAVFSLSRREPLGTIMRMDTDIPYGFTTLGVHGKLPGNETKASEQGERVRRLLLDEAPEEVMEDDAAAAIDFGDRVLFWGAQVGAKTLPDAQDLAPLVDASAGLTHLLPVAVERASAEAAQAPARFGQVGEGGAAGQPELLRALEWVRGKSEAEREVLFEDMLQKQVAEELARRQQEQSVELAKIGTKLPLALTVGVAVLALGLLAWMMI